MLYKIITPNPTFTGERAGVTFIAGIAYTSDALAADELRRMGYVVTMVATDLTGGAHEFATSEVDQTPPVRSRAQTDAPKPRQRKAAQERS